MVILVDKEALSVMNQLCDIALKSGGIQNLDGVNRILGCVKVDDNAVTKLINRMKKEDEQKKKKSGESTDEPPKEG